MTKPDDASLSPQDLAAIEKHAVRLLDESDAWDVYPVPIEDLLATASLQLAPSSAFNGAAIMAYIKGKAAAATQNIKSAVSKIFGIYDANESLIHIDDTVKISKQNFLKLHETGHHRIPTHRKMYQLFQDCEETLSHDIADQFEREANNFARYVLFKGETFGQMAADSALDIKVPIRLAKKFGASIYASCREYARSNQRDCLVYVLEPIETINGAHLVAEIRRIEASPTFAARFGIPQDKVITPSHAIWPAIPIGKKMALPHQFTIQDRNAVSHECLAEGFDTTYNLIILVYPTHALTRSISLGEVS